MSRAVSPTVGAPLRRLPGAARWGVLLAASAVAAAALQAIRLPAALLLGPLAAAVVIQTAGGTVKVPRALMVGAQAVIGCLVARSITAPIVAGFASHWLLILAVVALSLSGGAAIGWAMSRLRIVQGTTAIWGMLPGAAPAMMMMAEAHGGDVRLVAFMQYLRVVMVAAVASVAALIFAHGGGARFPGGVFPPVDLPSFAETVAIGCVGGGLGLVSKIPAGALLGPLALGAVLNVMGLVRIELPPALLITSYALIGWNTGLRFTGDVLAAAARALPQCLGATALLMTFCGFLAWILTALLHVDPLTAYLATSPGGADAAAVIAASTKVDTPFVMALQTVRMVVILAIGPQLAKWAAGTLKPGAARLGAPALLEPEPLDLGDVD
jgi:uncharacterized protein